jgi:hypothetical protein
VGVLFFAHLDNGSGYGVDQVTPELRRELTSVGVPPEQQDVLISGFRACVQDRSAGSDPTEVPASCQAGKSQPSSPEAEAVQKILSDAGQKANAYNFERAFGLTMLYAVGALLLVFVGMFGLPRAAAARDPAAEVMGVGDAADAEAILKQAPRGDLVTQSAH